MRSQGINRKFRNRQVQDVEDTRLYVTKMRTVVVPLLKKIEANQIVFQRSRELSLSLQGRFFDTKA